jgi:tetratricopeptide (TPR) repeat protein
MAVVMALAASAQAKSPAEEKILKAADGFAANQPEPLRPFFKALYIEGEHNAVLNFDYLGLAALEAGEYPSAEKAFDGAIARIEAIYADNPSARKAKSLFAEEKVKDFKGEPYERAMTYFYRGLLYVRAGDYQNARASFLSAEQQSMMSESETYQGTFGLMDFLAGWASHCDGDEAKAVEFGERAAKMQPEVFGSLHADVSFLGLVDVGTSPTKVGVGKYKEKLTFMPSDAVPTPPDVTANATQLGPVVLGADLNWQATTRGGRPVDAVLNGKAQWKSNTEGASSALTTVGYTAALQGGLSGNQGLQQAGEIGVMVGLVGGLFASAMTPAADTRTWSTLPAGVTLVSGQAPDPGSLAMTFTVAGSSTPTPAALTVRAGQCGLAWGRTRSSIDPFAPNIARPVLTESKHEALNQQFRATLEATFEGPQPAAVAAASPVNRQELPK